MTHALRIQYIHVTEIKQRMTQKKGTIDGAGNNNKDKVGKDEVVGGRVENVSTNCNNKMYERKC